MDGGDDFDIAFQRALQSIHSKIQRIKQTYNTYSDLDNTKGSNALKNIVIPKKIIQVDKSINLHQPIDNNNKNELAIKFNELESLELNYNNNFEQEIANNFKVKYNDSINVNKRYDFIDKNKNIVDIEDSGEDKELLDSKFVSEDNHLTQLSNPTENFVNKNIFLEKDINNNYETCSESQYNQTDKTFPKLDLQTTTNPSTNHIDNLEVIRNQNVLSLEEMDKREVLIMQKEIPRNSPLRNCNGNGFYNSDDDRLSNDFFYDEEFTIPFDANLNNDSWNMTSSKSESFLCKLGKEYEKNPKRHKIDYHINDSDSSEASLDLTTQPLFSSHSECPDEFAVEDDDKGSDNVFNEEKAFTSDWKSPNKKPSYIKKHYKLSFDRGPFKIWSSGDEAASKSSFENFPNFNNSVSKSTNITKKYSVNCTSPIDEDDFTVTNSQHVGRRLRKKAGIRNGKLTTWDMVKISSTQKKNYSKKKEKTSRMNFKTIPEKNEINSKITHFSNFEKNEADVKQVEKVIDDGVTQKSNKKEYVDLFKKFQEKRFKEDESSDVKNEANESYRNNNNNDITSINSNENSEKINLNSFPKFQNLGVINNTVTSPTTNNTLSSHSTNSSVQTSLLISFPVTMESKALQTSLVDPNDDDNIKRENINHVDKNNTKDEKFNSNDKKCKNKLSPKVSNKNLNAENNIPNKTPVKNFKATKSMINNPKNSLSSQKNIKTGVINNVGRTSEIRKNFLYTKPLPDLSFLNKTSITISSKNANKNSNSKMNKTAANIDDVNHSRDAISNRKILNKKLSKSLKNLSYENKDDFKENKKQDIFEGERLVKTSGTERQNFSIDDNEAEVKSNLSSKIKSKINENVTKDNENSMSGSNKTKCELTSMHESSSSSGIDPGNSDSGKQSSVFNSSKDEISISESSKSSFKNLKGSKTTFASAFSSHQPSINTKTTKNHDSFESQKCTEKTTFGNLNLSKKIEKKFTNDNKAFRKGSAPIHKPAKSILIKNKNTARSSSACFNQNDYKDNTSTEIFSGTKSNSTEEGNKICFNETEESSCEKNYFEPILETTNPLEDVTTKYKKSDVTWAKQRPLSMPDPCLIGFNDEDIVLTKNQVGNNAKPRNNTDTLENVNELLKKNALQISSLSDEVAKEFDPLWSGNDKSEKDVKESSKECTLKFNMVIDLNTKIEESNDDCEDLNEDMEVKQERFRAKKSVSFSEKILYHPNCIRNSPVDSPNSPTQSSPLILPPNPFSPQIHEVANFGSLNAHENTECNEKKESSAALKTLDTTCINANDDDVFNLISNKIKDNIGINNRQAFGIDEAVNFDRNISNSDDDDDGLPPVHFQVSLSSSSSLSDIENQTALSHSHLQHKHDLATDLIKAVGIVLKYVGEAKDSQTRMKICSTVESPKMGSLVLDHLCPSMLAIVLDGLKTSVPSLFGKVKDTPCKFFEESVKEDEFFRNLHQMTNHANELTFLTNHWLKFNAYLFALLNLKLMDRWLWSVVNNKALLQRHYSQNSFLQLCCSDLNNKNNSYSNSCNNSNLENNKTKNQSNNNSPNEDGCLNLLLKVLSCLRLLSEVPFCLEYDFEVRLVEHRRQAHMAKQLLHRHMSLSSYTEPANNLLANFSCADKQAYSSFNNGFNEKNNVSANFNIANKNLKNTQSLCLDHSKNSFNSYGSNDSLGFKKGTLKSLDENSSVLFWSSNDFSNFTKIILNKTQEKILKGRQRNGAFSPLTEHSFEGENIGNVENSNSFSEILKQYTGITLQQNPQNSVSSFKKRYRNPEILPKKNIEKPHQQDQMSSSFLQTCGLKIVDTFDKLLLGDPSCNDPSNQKLNSNSTQDVNINKFDFQKDVVNHSRPKNENKFDKVNVGKTPENMLRTAICDFEAVDEDYLSLKKGDKVMVLRQLGGTLCVCRHASKDGLVKKSCLSIE